MVKETRTIEIDADTYSHALPDDYGDTVEIGLSAFTDSVYIKFPRTDRGGTNDYCLKYDTVFKGFLNAYRPRGESFRARIHCPDELRGTGELVKESFEGLMEGSTEDDYWRGFKTGHNVGSDSHTDWTDLTWRIFKKQWGACGSDWKRSILLDVAEAMARNGQTVCNRTKDWFQIPDWGTPTGSYVATVSAEEAGRCPDCGADLSETQTCTSSSNRTRVPNKYRCDPEKGGCGRRYKGITTG